MPSTGGRHAVISWRATTSGSYKTGGHRAGHANRAAVAAVPRDQLDLVGIGLHAARDVVDKVLKGARMHD